MPIRMHCLAFVGDEGSASGAGQLGATLGLPVLIEHRRRLESQVVLNLREEPRGSILPVDHDLPGPIRYMHDTESERLSDSSDYSQYRQSS